MTGVCTLTGLARRLGMLAVAFGAASAAQAYELKIESLSLANVRALEVVAATGDDRGGIAFANGAVYLTGDSSTARFQASDLGSYSKLGTVYDGMFSTFSDGKVYAMSGLTNYTYPGGFGKVETLGAPATAISLSQGIASQHFGSVMFSGYDAGYEWDFSSHNVLRIDPRTGMVTVVGNVALQGPTGAETWASWGVVEHFGGQDYLTYASIGGIKRTRVSDGATELIFSGVMADMASFTIDPAGNKWFFHHEGTSQVRAGDETLGFADARITMIADVVKPVPEPGSMLLLGVGLLGAAAARRRSRR